MKIDNPKDEKQLTKSERDLVLYALWELAHQSISGFDRDIDYTSFAKDVEERFIVVFKI